jgi:hypothetical protein
MLAPLVAVLVWADRKLNISGRAVEWFLPRALKWIVLGADIANREFD